MVYNKDVMKKWLLFGAISISILGGILFNIPTASANSCGGVSTALIECGDKESGIGEILSVVINVMSVSVGILGIIGIAVSGVQYLTAQDSEEKVRKAKRRIFEIIIGLAVYALFASIAQWLLPGANFNPSDLPYYETPEPENPSGGGNNGGGNSGGGNNGGNTTPTEEKCDVVSKEWIAEKGDRVQGYYLNIPQGTTESTPIMIYLHGCGEANSGRTSLLGLKSVLSMFSSTSFISIVPHATLASYCSTEWTVSDVKNLVSGTGVGKKVSDKLSSCGGISNRKKYIMGMSDGAIATWKTVSAYPSLFTAAAPKAAGVSEYEMNRNNFNKTRVVGIIGSLDYDHMQIKENVKWIQDASPSMNHLMVVYNGDTHSSLTGNIKYDQLFSCLLSGSNTSSACTKFAQSGK